MKCSLCKTKFKEIKFYHGIKYFCSSSCRQEYIKNLGNNQFDRTVKIKPIKQTSSKNSNTPAKFTSKTKGEMLKRDGGCIICGSRNNLDFHHCYFSQEANYGGNRNDLNQGVAICRDHHNMAHSCKKGEGVRQKCIDYLNNL